ncbi:phosphoribosylanthranilate isomerase [Gemmatimonas aurantiaca]|uniref:phosphoribosylanthranilate isomerase n=1 Tax=Gemmatimonas aurantiaca TaxID=173480 RepID=UPI00301C7B32
METPTKMRVKICGLTRVADADHAEAQGASYLGAILAGGPRLLTVDAARLVLGPRRQSVRRVAVFGDQSAQEIVSIAERLDLDVLQLHGTIAEGDPEKRARMVVRLREETGRLVWPVIRVAGQTFPEGTVALAQAADALVLDAHVVGQLGGTGVALDWSGLRDAMAGLRQQVPSLTLVLAGGLRPENVATAIRLLAPQVVDVSSGVEAAPGVKDPERVRQFVTAAQTGSTE